MSSPARRPSDHISTNSSFVSGGGFLDSTNDASSDLTSIKSEESTDSENFVIVGQAEDPEAAETALFNIHSKRASPVVEVAAEVIIYSMILVHIISSSATLKKSVLRFNSHCEFHETFLA